MIWSCGLISNLWRRPLRVSTSTVSEVRKASPLFIHMLRRTLREAELRNDVLRHSMLELGVGTDAGTSTLVDTGPGDRSNKCGGVSCVCAQARSHLNSQVRVQC